MNAGLDRPLRLVPQVRHYDWGTRDFIPRLRGRKPGELPEAELWFGAHPDAPAGVVLESGSAEPERRLPPLETPASVPHPDTIPLNRLIADHRDELLGPGTTGAELPFLTKILSAAQPLSIQAHPNREQAVRGFAAETGTRPVTSGDRNYRDPNHKPELLYALTPFSALSGFRPAAEATRFLSALGLERLRPNIDRLASEGATAYRPLLEALHRHTGTDFAAAAARAARRASTTDDPNCREAMRWVVHIAADHPDDALVVAPLFLRLIRLNPGQALFTGAGVPHSYLEGSAVEVMANSDNVLRLGLTSKRVDAEELLGILIFEAVDAALIKPSVKEHSWGTRCCFRPPIDDFRLDVLHLVNEGEAPLGPDGRARIVLALEGVVEVRNAHNGSLLRSGQAALLPAAAKVVTATGQGTLALTMSHH